MATHGAQYTLVPLRRLENCPPERAEKSHRRLRIRLRGARCQPGHNVWSRFGSTRPLTHRTLIGRPQSVDVMSVSLSWAANAPRSSARAVEVVSEGQGPGQVSATNGTAPSGRTVLPLGPRLIKASSACRHRAWVGFGIVPWEDAMKAKLSLTLDEALVAFVDAEPAATRSEKIESVL